MFEAGNSRTLQTVLLFIIVALLCSLAYSKVIYQTIEPAQVCHGTPIINYCCVQDWEESLEGKGNTNIDPCFVEMGYWTQPSPRQPNSSVWIEGDYHLKSEAGRWDPNSQSWVVDYVTSPCIDAGDPNSPVGDEPDPNGGRINMGAYGGTEEASKSPAYSWWFETTQGLIRAFGFKSGE